MTFAIKAEVGDSSAETFSFADRQATNKIAGISDRTARFLRGFMARPDEE